MINITVEDLRDLRKRAAERLLERCSCCNEADVELIEIDGQKLCPGCVHDRAQGPRLFELSDVEPRGAMDLPIADPFDPEVP